MNLRQHLLAWLACNPAPIPPRRDEIHAKRIAYAKDYHACAYHPTDNGESDVRRDISPVRLPGSST